MSIANSLANKRKWSDPEYRKRVVNSIKQSLPKTAFVKGDVRLIGENNPAKRLEVRKKISINRSLAGNPSGSLAHNWKGGVNVLNEGLKGDPRYKGFRMKIFKRDDYTCQICGVRGGVELNLDHIKPKSIFPELAWDENNVRTVCHPCHRKTETYGGGAVRMKNEKNKRFD